MNWAILNSIVICLNKAYSGRNALGWLSECCSSDKLFNWCWEVLQSVVGLYSRVFIIIDALDEFPVYERTALLSRIFELRAKFSANVFATSRFIPDIERQFQGCSLLPIRADNDDIRTYLDGHRSKLPGFMVNDPCRTRDFKTTVIEAVDGM